MESWIAPHKSASNYRAPFHSPIVAWVELNLISTGFEVNSSAACALYHSSRGA